MRADVLWLVCDFGLTRKEDGRALVGFRVGNVFGYAPRICIYVSSLEAQTRENERANESGSAVLVRPPAASCSEWKCYDVPCHDGLRSRSARPASATDCSAVSLCCRQRRAAGPPRGPSRSRRAKACLQSRASQPRSLASIAGIEAGATSQSGHASS